MRFTSLVGRDSELRDVLGVLGGNRLLTLTGPGGTGKTRLALAAAHAAHGRFPGGAAGWDSRPSPSRTSWPGRWPASSACPTLPARMPPRRSPVTSAAAPVLIVLDNCEHLAAAVADLAERLLAGCPALTILATSREPLGVEGECSWPVPPLSWPDAVRLFEQRAQLVRPSFRVSDDNADTVRQICRRLDGLPLAIELAAARMRILSATQLAERLDDLFAVLTGGARSAPRRHQALRATLDWSYELLTADERAVFRRLAIFSGGFTLAAAEQVAAGDGIAARDILDLLTRLADKSLLRVDQGSHGAHYQLLTTIRDYAKERLTEAGEAEPLRRAHLRYFIALAEEIGPLVDGGSPEQGPKGRHGLEELLDQLDLSRPDIRVALDFAQESGDTVAALRIAGQLGRYAYLRGHYREVRDWMDQAVVAGEDGPAELRAKALLGSGRLALLQCDTGRRYGGSRRRCGFTANAATRPASPARCRCWAASPASRAGTCGRWSCTRRACPSRSAPATGEPSPAPVATWASWPGCSATSAGPSPSARRHWTSSVSSVTWREPRGPCSAWGRSRVTKATPAAPRRC